MEIFDIEYKISSFSTFEETKEGIENMSKEKDTIKDKFILKNKYNSQSKKHDH